MSSWNPRKFTLDNQVGDTEMMTFSTNSTNARKTRFKNIDPTVEYTFRVCTLINGKSITRRLLTLKPIQPIQEIAKEPSLSNF